MQHAEPQKTHRPGAVKQQAEPLDRGGATTVRRRRLVPVPGLVFPRADAAPARQADESPIRRTRATAPQAKKGESAPVAVVPVVTDAKLKNLVKDLYKGATMKDQSNRIGDGSCADAIRHELANPGAHVGGRGHVQKGQEYSRGLSNWLARNPATPENGADRAVAQQIIDDIADALGGS